MGWWKTALRLTVVLTGLLAMVGLVGCGGDGDNGGLTFATVTPGTASTAGGSVVPAEGNGAPTPGPTATPDPSRLTGFVYPLAGACLPQGDQLMPNAPREYRQGIHEGVDLYAVDNCTDIRLGTPVIAAKAGRVIRADHAYVDLTAAKLAVIRQDPTSESSLDAFRGRQVYIEHEGGIVTRYCHLSGIAPGLEVGDSVAQGETIAFVGESGTPQSVGNPGQEHHLHFEVRVGDSYLGEGLPPAEVRAAFLALFSP